MTGKPAPREHLPANELGASTVAVRGGFEPAVGEGISPPIHLTSTFYHPIDPDPNVLPYSYGRDRSPAFIPLERTIADLEGGQFGLAFNAGMSAAIPLLFEAKPGTALVMPEDCYFGIRVFAETEIVPTGVELRLVDQTDLAAVERVLDGASFFWTETPTNPYLAVADLEAIGTLCAAKGVPWATDNTFASPILQNPLAWGATAVMHSVTKYIGGHSDLVMGAVVTNDEALFNRLRTYRVYYPGLSDHPGHAIAAKQMRGGFGGMLSFEIAGGAVQAEAVINACRVWMPATSLGSVESLIERRARWTGEVAGPGLIRLSVGIEDLDDLWHDLERALLSIG